MKINSIKVIFLVNGYKIEIYLNITAKKKTKTATLKISNEKASYVRNSVTLKTYVRIFKESFIIKSNSIRQKRNWPTFFESDVNISI